MKSSCSGRGSCMGADRTRHSPVDQRNPPPLRTCGRNLRITLHHGKKNPGRTRVPPGFCILAPKPTITPDRPRMPQHPPVREMEPCQGTIQSPLTVCTDCARSPSSQRQFFVSLPAMQPPKKNPGRTRVPPGLACSYQVCSSRPSPQTVRRRRSTRPPRNPPTTSTAMVWPGSGTEVAWR